MGLYILGWVICHYCIYQSIYISVGRDRLFVQNTLGNRKIYQHKLRTSVRPSCYVYTSSTYGVYTKQAGPNSYFPLIKKI